MKQTFPTIDGHIIELTKYSGSWSVDIFGYTEHDTKAEAIAAARKRIAANRPVDPSTKKPLSERIAETFTKTTN